MTLALVFPGQGTQHPQMLAWLDGEPAAAATLARLAAALGAGWRDRLADAGWAADNRVAQCLLTGLGVAAWQCLAAQLPPPAVVAGYSVGELPAFCAAGVFDAATALQLAADRAEAMSNSVAGVETGLLAVHGATPQRLAGLCRRLQLALAIRLAADRVVLGGRREALDRAQAELAAEGRRCSRLAVALASHTPWMESAAAAFARRLANVDFAPPRAALVCNAAGAALRGTAALKQALAGQIASTLRWDRCSEAIAERRVRCVLEVGPGNTLARLWNETHPGIPARSVDEFRSPAAVVGWVRGRLR